jgi:hypothetical protein
LWRESSYCQIRSARHPISFNLCVTKRSRVLFRTSFTFPNTRLLDIACICHTRALETSNCDFQIRRKPEREIPRLDGRRNGIRTCLNLISAVTSNRTTRYSTGETVLNIHPMFLYKKCNAACSSDIRAYWAQIRVFRQIEQETEKKHDCVAERRGFEALNAERCIGLHGRVTTQKTGHLSEFQFPLNLISQSRGLIHTEDVAQHNIM